MNYPKYDPPSPPPAESQDLTYFEVQFVKPDDFPAMRESHMLAIVHRGTSRSLEKHFVSNEVFDDVVRCFDVLE